MPLDRLRSRWVLRWSAAWCKEMIGDDLSRQERGGNRWVKACVGSHS